MSALVKSDQDLGSVFGTFTEDQVELIKRTVCKNASDNELKLFLYTCKHAGLDPLLKQIYAIKRGNTMTIQTSIDGLRLIAERTGRYAPGHEPKYAYNASNEILSATAYVNKMTPDGKWHSVAATAYFGEYVQAFNGKLTTFWNKMPHVMLAKCAEANALRKAFPFELAGLYSSEEMINGLNKQAEADEFLTPELVGSAPQDEVQIVIPEGIEVEKVDAYLEYLSEHYGKPIPTIRKWINDRPEKFWESFHKWTAEHEEVPIEK